jgi:hypothetical protein
MTDFELKPIDRSYLGKALEKAERYRLLNWPEEAESICLDVLAADQQNQEAIATLVLALSDQFLVQSRAARVTQALEWVGRVRDEYRRTYLSGIIHERQGRAHLARGLHGPSAYAAFREAMSFYEKAEALEPAGIQEAVLRFNSCVRTIEREALAPHEEHGELPLE